MWKKSVKLTEAEPGSRNAKPGIGSVGALPAPTANMAHVRQSSPDSGLAFQVKALKPLKVRPSSLISASRQDRNMAGSIQARERQQRRLATIASFDS